MALLNELACAMTQYYSGDPARIQHFMKVHAFSKLIGEQECMSAPELFTLEAAALAHDIGIKICEQTYGNCSGKLQEQEGPAIARELLTRLGFDKSVTERVCYLVGHHHTYGSIEGLDYQVLVEADFLVNLFEGNSSRATCASTLDKIFKTECGTMLCRAMFGL